MIGDHDMDIYIIYIYGYESKPCNPAVHIHNFFASCQNGWHLGMFMSSIWGWFCIDSSHPSSSPYLTTTKGFLSRWFCIVPLTSWRTLIPSCKLPVWSGYESNAWHRKNMFPRWVLMLGCSSIIITIIKHILGLVFSLYWPIPSPSKWDQMSVPVSENLAMSNLD